ncbi:MAG: TraR/DksA family transcriptional regulator [Planctomycetota bacterium]|nr:MAG: TraR/DksA family transcriptional regulator [Planctomycetota bacterium]
MSKLSPELLQAMKQELIRKRDDLTRSVTRELDDMSNNEAHHLADLADAGGDANDEDRSFRLLEISGAELEQVEAALEKIEKGTYGICESCEKPIGLDRLKALPFATMCISCKRAEESSESGRF